MIGAGTLVQDFQHAHFIYAENLDFPSYPLSIAQALAIL